MPPNDRKNLANDVLLTLSEGGLICTVTWENSNRAFIITFISLCRVP